MQNGKPFKAAYDKNFDAEFCGSIPLNHINMIQAHGILLVLDKNDFRIIQLSENVEQQLGLSIAKLLGRSLVDFIGKDQLEALRSRMERWQVSNHLPLVLWLEIAGEKKPFSVSLHTREDYLLLELEKVKEVAESGSFLSIYQEISYVIAALKETSTVEDLQEVAVSELKKLSGFDRVMIYQFDERWNGTVVAEAMEEGMNPYLGLRFPASDVPRQARELYIRTPYRLIPDANAAAVKLYPVINPITKSLTDIAECVLRAVPMVHVEYLQNMQVGASMSTPIMVENRLWGLISCHHRTARGINFEMRSSFEIISGILAAQISAREKEESFRYRSSLHKTELKLLEQLYSQQSLAESLFQKPAKLMDLLQIEGMVLVLGKEYESCGEVPDVKMVKELVKWLSRYNKEKVFATDSLPQLFKEAERYRDRASGLIALQIRAGKNYLLGFRPEVIRDVNWGGNPNEAIQVEADGKRYHPRNSFKLWKEQVEYTSESWQPEELEVASDIRISILEKALQEQESL